MRRFCSSIISLILAISLLSVCVFAVPSAITVNDHHAESLFTQAEYTLFADSITPSEAFAGGNGSESSPYIISNENELALFAKVINEKKSGFESAFYALGNDIDLGGKTITPIGNETAPFSANFDGKGFSISNFSIAEGQYMGLFGYIFNGNVKNLGISGLDIQLSSSSVFSFAGALAGYVESTEGKSEISKVSVSDVTMSIVASTAKIYAGGIIGYGTAYSKGNILISDCFSDADISLVNSYGSGYSYAGGIAGEFDAGSLSISLIENSISSGSISSESYNSSRAGGIVGYLFSSGYYYEDAPSLLAEDTDVMIKNSFSVADIYSLSKYYTSAAGSIVGAMNSHATILNALYPDDAVVEAAKLKTTLKATVSTDGTEVASSILKDASVLSGTYGFDFENTWEISANKNDGYPYLKCILANVVYVPVFSTSMQAYLNLESVVTMSVGYKFEDMQDITPADYTENLGLLIWNAADAPKADEATYENCENIIEGARYNSVDKRFETTTDGIAAKNLGDSLTFRAYYLNEDGTYSYSKLVSNYSPKKYCYNQIKNYPDDTVNTALMASILNYGAEAQIYFDHDTANLMNAELSEELKAVAWDASLVRSDYNVPDGKDSAFVRDSSITSRGGYLNLEGAIDYNFYAAVDFEPVSATICYWTEADVKKLDSLKLTNASSSEAMKYNSAMSRYEGKYEGQPAKKMFETVFALMVFEKADGTKITSGVVGYSPERYAYINYNKNNKESPLAKALAVYGDAARTYFETK